MSVNVFAAKVLSLIKTISKTFERLPETEDINKYPENLLEEWNEFHSKNIFQVLFEFYLEFYSKLTIFDDDLSSFRKLRKVSEAYQKFPQLITLSIVLFFSSQ